MLGYPMVMDEVNIKWGDLQKEYFNETTIEDADIGPVYFARDARSFPFKRGMKRLSLADKGMMMGLGKRGTIGDRGNQIRRLVNTFVGSVTDMLLKNLSPWGDEC